LKSSLETHLEPLGMDVSLDVKGQERRLKPEIETTLFRVAQEAILNIRRHAEAESAQVTLEFGETEVCLHIEDDGSGFDASEVEQSDDRTRGSACSVCRNERLWWTGPSRSFPNPARGRGLPCGFQ